MCNKEKILLLSSIAQFRVLILLVGLSALNSMQAKEYAYDIDLRSATGAAKPETAQQKSSTGVRNIIGTVVDDTNDEPLIGVSLQVKGTSTGTSTDIDGNFSLEGVTSETIIMVSYLGYETQETIVGNMGFVEIRIMPDSKNLQEVVVVGAGTQRKISVTGAITSMQGSSLSMPTSSLTSSFAGQLAGVVSMTKS